MSSNHKTADLTGTYTQDGGPQARKAPAVPGLLVVYSAASVACGVHPIDQRSIIGRSAQCDVVLDDSKLSRQHAEISRTVSGLSVADLKSRNDTFVNGAALGSRRVQAHIGDVVRVGRSLLLLVGDSARYARFPPPLVGPMIGGPDVDHVRDAIRRCATSGLTVLIEGESGTGKEVATELLHRSGQRSGELVRVNCAAIPHDLIESELFGHLRGAFSGSDDKRAGLFRRAQGGTLMLDEVGELPLTAQAKLLRVIEDHKVRPVGSDHEIDVDVQLVAATNRDLGAAVQRGTFRLDLYHRLAAARVQLPPLRTRRADIPLLTQYFLSTCEGPHAITAEAMEQLLLAPWEGNVRALRASVWMAAARARDEGRPRIEVGDLDRKATPAPAASATPAPALAVDAEAIALRSRITTALQLCAGNVSQVSAQLRIPRPRLYALIRSFGLDLDSYRPQRSKR